MIRKTALSLVMIVLALVAGGFLLPSSVQVERSIVIAAPAEAIFPHVNDLRAFQAWSPWAERDPQMRLEFSGPDRGVGQHVRWESDHDEVGSGTQEIVESVPHERVATRLDFGGMGTARAAFVLVPEGDRTKVTWLLDSELGSKPLMRYLGLMLDEWVGADYEAGLSRLKELVESG